MRLYHQYPTTMHANVDNNNEKRLTQTRNIVNTKKIKLNIFLYAYFELNNSLFSSEIETTTQMKQQIEKNNKNKRGRAHTLTQNVMRTKFFLFFFLQLFIIKNVFFVLLFYQFNHL